MKRENEILCGGTEKIGRLEEFCRQSFVNLEFLLRSSRIGCFHCGHVFLYDGTEETGPWSLDGVCGMCPECLHFSLFGDADGDFTQEEMLNCALYLKKLRTRRREGLPAAVRLFLECDSNTGLIRECDSVRCLSCGAPFDTASWNFFAKDGKPGREDATFVCPNCMAPAVVPEYKYGLCRQLCVEIGLLRPLTAPEDGNG
jgi:hypothetical protein